MNQLGLVGGVVEWSSTGGWWRKKTITTQRSIVDWSVDGVALRDLVARREGNPGSLPTEHPPLVEEWPWPSIAVRNLGELLGEMSSALDGGRVPLLFCPLCADLGCATLTAEVVVGAGVVEWRDLGWETNWQRLETTESHLEPSLTLRFDLDAYMDLLRDRLAHFAVLAEAQDDDRR